ncbi:MAG: GlsB/YeaQ/YmgE family stress response membrane protein [Streptococcus sp.]|nr:GlsB/YeaQ/YmgE family stress response membrane protein [Streptococcus sp.]
MIWSLFVGAVIGMIAAKVADKQPMGCFFNCLSGLIGASVGQSLFGSWGPSLAGMAILPSILGSTIVIIVASHFFGRR